MLVLPCSPARLWMAILHTKEAVRQPMTTDMITSMRGHLSKMSKVSNALFMLDKLHPSHDHIFACQA